MVSKGKKEERKRDSDLLRRQPTKKRKRQFVLVCEGEVTEPSYFRALKKEHDRIIDIVLWKGHGVPRTLLKQAKEEKMSRDFEDGDQVWIVFDRDQHPHVSQVINEARKAEIGIAFSNPSFELWLLWHFCDYTAHVEREKARTALKEHLPTYDKDVADHFTKLRDRIPKAKSRAAKRAKEAEAGGAIPTNPYSSVYRLVQAIEQG